VGNGMAAVVLIGFYPWIGSTGVP